MLYFAYGSNLDDENWSAWCNHEGYDPRSIEPLGPAWLPDYELVFHYQSRLRKGGALDIRPRRGTAVAGALFRVNDWEALDAKEGVSGSYYQRLPVTALTHDGNAHRATTYTVCDARVGEFVPPGPEYRAMVSRGLSRFGHDHEAFLVAAEGRSPAASPSMLFTYGTLMRGQRGHALIEPRVRCAHGPAHVAGASLVRVDWYPGLVLGSDGTVRGELYEIDGIGTLLQELDIYEEFLGYEDPQSLYRRSLLNVVADEGPALAWTYVFLGDSDSLPRVSSGFWMDA